MRVPAQRRAALLALLASGCSFVIVDGPPRDHATRPRVACTASRLGPVLDVILASYLLGAAVGFATRDVRERDERDDDGLLATHAGLGGLAAAGAIYGFVETGRCRAARERFAGDEPPPEPAPPEPTRWGIGLEAAAGGHSGVGGGVRVEAGRAGLHLGAGWQPVFLGVSTFPIFTFFQSTGPEPPRPNPPAWYVSGVQANADVHFLFLRVTRRAEVGLTLGYRYSTLLGHGGVLGLYTQLHRGRRLGLFAAGGASFYPEAESRIRVEAGYPMGANLIPDLFAGLSLGVSFSP